MSTSRTLSILFLAIFAFVQTACVNLSVYGPFDDFSTLSNDHISDSVRRHMRVGQPHGREEIEKDAYQRLVALGFEINRAKRDFEESNAICSLGETELLCKATRTWLVVWPASPSDISHKRHEEMALLITYRIKVKEKMADAIHVELEFLK